MTTQKTCGELFEGIDCTIIGNADEPVGASPSEAMPCAQAMRFAASSV